MTSAQRLLNAEKQFSELADQLQNLKSAAQAIEQAGHATDQMRALAESAIATASSLGAKISETADILQKQNIPERLLEKEARLNSKFIEIKAAVSEVDQKAIAAASSLGEKIGLTTDIIQKQNIPERLLEKEARLNSKFTEIKVAVSEVDQKATATASSLGEKIGQTTDILQKQNIPERLLEKEARLNAKFLDVKTAVSAVDQKAEGLQGQKMPERLAATESRLLAKSDESSVQLVKYLRIIILLQFLFTVGIAYLFLKFRS
jgi:hypothetical protein